MRQIIQECSKIYLIQSGILCPIYPCHRDTGILWRGGDTTESICSAKTKFQSETFKSGKYIYFYFIVVTIYATLGNEAVVYGFNEVESPVVMTDAALMPKLKNLGSQLRFIKTIIYFGDTKKSLISEFPDGLEIYSLQQVKDLGSKIKNYVSTVFFFISFFFSGNKSKENKK